MASQFVKPYVKTNKNDMADAEAICEAVARSTMRFVSIKNAGFLRQRCLPGLRITLTVGCVIILQQQKPDPVPFLSFLLTGAEGSAFRPIDY